LALDIIRHRAAQQKRPPTRQPKRRIRRRRRCSQAQRSQNRWQALPRISSRLPQSARPSPFALALSNRLSVSSRYTAKTRSAFRGCRGETPSFAPHCFDRRSTSLHRSNQNACPCHSVFELLRLPHSSSRGAPSAIPKSYKILSAKLSDGEAQVGVHISSRRRRRLSKAASELSHARRGSCGCV